jgi:uncharacterized protein YndB with AHSA1/START domain
MADLKQQVPIDAYPDKVYAAVATQNGMRNWWTADATMDETVGGQAEFGFDKRGMVFRMDITKLDSAKEVVMQCHGNHPEWAGTALTWTIRAGMKSSTRNSCASCQR